MNMTDIVAWGQLASSGAVLVTLVYLAIQTRQTNAAIQASARQSQYELDLTNLFSLAGHPDLLVKIERDEELAEVDQMRITYLWMAALRHAELLHTQFKSGVLDSATWDTERRIIAAYLSTPRMRKWWRHAGKLPYAPDFVEVVDRTVEEKLVPDDYAIRMFTWDA